MRTGNPTGEEPNVSARAVRGRPWNPVPSDSPGQHPENTGARLSRLGRGSLRSGSSQVILGMLRKPEPLPQHQACTPAGQPKLGMEAPAQLGSGAPLLQTPLASSSGPSYGFRTSQAQNAAPGWGGWWRGGLSFDPMQSRGRGWEEQQTES